MGNPDPTNHTHQLTDELGHRIYKGSLLTAKDRHLLEQRHNPVGVNSGVQYQPLDYQSLHS